MYPQGNYYNILIPYSIMHIASNRTPNHISPSLQKENAKIESDKEFDHQQEMFLQSVFAENINQILRMNKQCFLEMEYYPRLRVSREREEKYKASINRIYKKQNIKILKQNIYRNSFIEKTCQTYLNYYVAKFPINTRYRNNKNQLFLNNCNNPTSENAARQVVKQRRKTTSSISSYVNECQLKSFKAYQAQNKTVTYPTNESLAEPSQLFIKTARSSISRQERLKLRNLYLSVKKSRIHSQKPNQCQQIGNMQFQGDQILISKPKLNQNNKKLFQKSLQTPLRFCTKQVLAIDQCQKKTIKGIQLDHFKPNIIKTTNIFYRQAGDLNELKTKVKQWRRHLN